ncbi:DUF58 domain-containing protein [Photobacterium sanguinicancri]|uniref:DUF58 domain-containing protein n=1 Tax=Photobacterium sanguinicancri TaxID=875932 RepID=A0AAW7YCY2_9GAMM|nr:DUF58 domain-containing protein [Photobacterium sanguinicancri]MDO6545399.1 DUF58 domain-containing protein [Photobacterium sanguinicancri]
MTLATPANVLPTHSDGVHLCLAELLQYKDQAVRWLAPAQSIWSHLNGKHSSRQKGRGMNFSEVRPYQAGDDIRAIDWRVTARTGKTHTKLFTEEREQPVMLLIDLSSSMQFGSQLMLKSVQAAHFASLLCWLTIKEQDRIGAIVYNGKTLHEIKPTGRQQGALRVINQLIASQQQINTNVHTQPHDAAQETSSPAIGFSAALRHLSHLCPKGSEIIIVSDFHALKADDKQSLSRLRHHNRIQFVQIHDPLEQGITAFRGTEQVADQTQSVWLNFSATNTREQLSTQFLHHQQLIKTLANSLAIPLYSLDAALPLLQQLGQQKGES